MSRDGDAETDAIQRYSERLTKERDKRPEPAPKPQELPIETARERLCELLSCPGIVIVEAPTGSGKSTQIPQYALSVTEKRIIVTQPRRIAAVALAARVAEELG